MPYIGLYIHPWHTYGQDILRGFSRYMSKKPDWECFLPWPGSTEQRTRLPADAMDALIMRVGGEEDVPLDFCQGYKRVIIASTNQLSASVDISWDNERIGTLAAEHLLEQGHRLIIFLGHLDQFPYQKQRADGLLRVAAERGCECRLINRDDMQRSDLPSMVNALPKPAAIFAASDPLGSEVLHAARAVRRRIPEELAVVSAGDNEIFCELSTPPLSSVALPGEEAGFLAAQRIDHLLSGQPPQPQVMLAPHYVTVRRSSDMLAMDDQAIAHAVRLIRNRALGELDVSDVHDSVPLSRRSLEVRFKKAVGRTIEQEIRRVRIEKAKRLLTGTDLSMDDIADRSGFTSAQRLSVVFAREEGEPPSVYRKRLRSEPP